MPQALKQVATVNHQGTVIAFAREDPATETGSTDIYYNVLDLTVSATDDAMCWTGFQELTFPDAVRPVGAGIANVSGDGDQQVLGAPAEPFKVVSDQKYVCIVRQSTAGTLLFNRFMLKKVPVGRSTALVLEPAWEVRFERSGKQDVPQSQTDAQNFLSPDSEPFLEPGFELWMIDGVAHGMFNLFLVPSETSSLLSWQFVVVRHDDATKLDRVELFSFPMDDAGLFDLRGVALDEDDGSIAPNQWFTLSDEDGRPLPIVGGPSTTLYAIQERTTSSTGESTLLARSTRMLMALTVMLPPVEKKRVVGGPCIATVDFAISKDGALAEIDSNTMATPIEPANEGLELQPSTYVALKNTSGLAIAGDFRIETWIYPTSQVKDDQFIVRGPIGEQADAAAPYVTLTHDLHLAAGFGSKDGHAIARETKDAVIALSTWSHVVVSYTKAAGFTILVNDQVVLSGEAAGSAPAGANAIATIGVPPDQPVPPDQRVHGFVGIMDLLRVFANDGTSDVLVGDWDLDTINGGDGEPKTTPDSSPKGNIGYVYGPMLVPSSAPSGDEQDEEEQQGYLQMDADGLTIFSGYLQFTFDRAPRSAPFLLNGSDGLVHLYYEAGEDEANAGDFDVVQLDAEAARAMFSAQWHAGKDDGLVLFLSQRSGTFMNRASIAIKTSPDTEQCDVTLDNGQSTVEQWKGVPRDLGDFIAVLSGKSTNDPNDPAFKAGKRLFYDNQGIYETARLTTDSEALDVRFVTRFPDELDLKSIDVGAPRNPHVADVTIKLTDSTWGEIINTWPNVPVDAADFLEVMGGVAPTGSYNYAQSVPSDVTLFTARAVAANNVLHNVLILSRDPTIQISITAIADDPDNVDVQITSKPADGQTRVKRYEPFSAPRAVDLFKDKVEEEEPDLLRVIVDGVAAAVQDQDVLAPASLLGWANAFAVYSDGAVQGDESVEQQHADAAILQGSTIATRSEPDPATLLGRSTLFSIMAETTPTTGGGGLVDFTPRAPLVVQATRGGWVQEPEGEAIELHGKNGITWPLQELENDTLAIDGDQTLELWCKPAVTTKSIARLLTYNRVGSIAHPDQPVRYGLGLLPGSSLEFLLNATVKGSLHLPAHEATVQLWVRLASSASDGRLIEVHWQNEDDLPDLFSLLKLELKAGKAVASLGTFGSVELPEALPKQTWVQLTASVRASDKPLKSTVTIYRDGDVDNKVSKSIRHGVLPMHNWHAVVGGTIEGTQHSVSMLACGAFVWNRALEDDEVKASNRKTVQPNDPGLVVAWYMSIPRAPTLPRATVIKNEALEGEHQNAAVAGAIMVDTGVYSFAAALNRELAMVATTLPLLTGWTHVASIYRSGHSLAFPGAQYADCGHDSSQNPDSAITWEAWIKPTLQGQAQVIVSKPGAYELGLTADGKLYFTIETTQDQKPVEVKLTSSNALPLHTVSYVAATVNVATQTSSTSVARAVGDSTKSAFLDAYLYLNGDVVAEEHDNASDISLEDSDVNLNFGRSSDEGAHYIGELSEVRLWNQALHKDVLGEVFRYHAPPTSQDGLISYWRFAEQAGKEAFDEQNVNNARLSSNELWEIFPGSATLTITVDGEPADVVELSPTDLGGWGVEQLTAGVQRDDAGNPAHGFTGVIDDLRIWSTALTPEQVADSMFKELTGTEGKLAGYWPFNNGSGTRVDNLTGHGDAGQLFPDGAGAPKWTMQSAPLGNEAPEVYNPLGGHETELEGKISGAPSVVEYADTQLDAYGVVFSVMKRCYVSVRDGQVQLVTDYKVGDLDTIYAGQVQTNPQLIGYIEGAPPVPSENQTVPYWSDALAYNTYSGNTSVTVTQSDQSVYSFTQTRNYDVSSSVSGGVGFYGALAGSTVIEMVGVEFNTELFTTDGHLGYEGGTEQGTNSDNEGTYGFGTLKTLSDTLAPGGFWEPTPPYNPEVGRRFIPQNVGYALVKSMTADLYLVRLKGTNTMVKTSVVPNIDIPQDVNIIDFPIDPRYTKNGTLDGMIGFKPDPTYPDASLSTRGSYFKPLEAYQLKREIERADKQLEAYFTQYDLDKANKAAMSEDPSSNKPSQTRLQPPTDNPSYDWVNQLGKRNLVNTYVWTAGGGFHAESEQALDSYSESYTGVSSTSSTNGLHVDLEIAVLGEGVYGELDALWTTAFEVSATKSKESDSSYGLSVDFTPESFLKLPLGDQAPQPYSDEDAPGKVDGYRFMSFFMSPSMDNFTQFESVVDRNWLENSTSPNAAALEQAMAQPNPAWRAFHRVTYVSRVPQQLVPAPAETTSPPVTPPANLAHNTVLTRLVGFLLRAAGVDDDQPPTPQQIGDAVKTLLAADKETYSLASLVPWWSEFVTTALENPRSSFYSTLLTLRADVLAYVLDYYDSLTWNDGGPVMLRRAARARRRLAGK